MTLNEPELLQHLMRTIDFTADDLALNRMGILSEHQVQLLRRNALGSTVLIATVGLFFGGVLLAGGFITGDELLSNILILSGAVSAPVILALAWFSLRGRLAEVAGLQGEGTQPQAKLPTVEGEGRKGQAGGGKRRRRYWYCQIGDLRFEIPFTAATVFVDGLTYQAYYTPSSKTLLSIEPKIPQPI